MPSVNLKREWQVLGVVLDRFNSIEHTMARIISAFVRPEAGRGKFFDKHVLHNSIIPFASKIRLVLAINREVGGHKLDKDKLHKLLNTRNALAHGYSAASVRENLNALAPMPLGEYLIVETLRNDGSLQERPRQAAIAEFIKVSDEVRSELKQLLERVKKHAA